MLLGLGLAFAFDIGEVFYIQNLASVPFIGGSSLSAPEESSYHGVECVAHNFTSLALGYFLWFVSPGDSHVISPSRIGLV